MPTPTGERQFRAVHRAALPHHVDMPPVGDLLDVALRHVGRDDGSVPGGEWFVQARGQDRFRPGLRSVRA